MVRSKTFVEGLGKVRYDVPFVKMVSLLHNYLERSAWRVTTVDYSIGVYVEANYATHRLLTFYELGYKDVR